MKHSFSEDDCQTAQVVYLTARRDLQHDLMFCAIPNAAKRSRWLAILLKKTGLVAGAPDLVIWMLNRLVHVENKVKGKYLTGPQKAFKAGLEALGYEYHVITATSPRDATDQLIAILEAT